MRKRAQLTLGWDDRMQRVFLDRTSQTLRNMTQRFAAKYDKRGRLTRPALTVSFTLEEYRNFVLGHFPRGAGNNWVTTCAYCGNPLTVEDFVTDHAVPVARGGELGLSNLVLCHDECNRLKGELNPAEFNALKRLLQSFAESGRRDVMKRLKQGGGFARLRYFQPKEKANAKN